MGNTGVIQLDMLLKENEGKLDTEHFKGVMLRWLESNEDASEEQVSKKLIQTALANVDIDAPNWTYLAAKEFLQTIYRNAQKNRGYTGEAYGSFYKLIKLLTTKQQGQYNYTTYDPQLLEAYSKEEIEELEKAINPEKDKLFSYIGLFMLNGRYLARPQKDEVYELPQERFMIIAMELMRLEDKSKRLEYVKEAYWALSNLYMTVATPTLANSGLSYGQLSSCFIDTVSDSLIEIYNSNTDVARLSKDGGGIGVYMGKVRGQGSAIKDFKGASSGVLPWIKQLNNTAVSVDQLGRRKGAIAVYLDIWHADILSFLDLKLNNGDDRKRAHDIFTGVTLPDLFMEKVEAREDWHLFDPHEVRMIMGYSIEDFYDEEEGSGSFRAKYQECVDNPLLKRQTIPAIDIMKRVMKSQLETGTPFMFYRDEVNRQNPNKHEGMIYCSNLCTEIAQNQTPTIQEKEFVGEVDGEEMIITYKKPGDFVVCNLSSINLGRAIPANVLGRLIKIQVRMLDNVIDLNTIDVKQAAVTNKKYRPIGLGTFGWHHLLALKGIKWETDEAVDYADKLYEEIAYLTIKASMELSKEKGSYGKFEGSEWHTGEYFRRKGYLDEDYESDFDWSALAKDIEVNGIRNGWLIAVAPNSSTSVIADSTASIDPIFKPFYNEEKKDYKLPYVAPDLDHKTYDIYRRSAYIVDQRWSVKQNAARQRHVDQAISFNFYVPNNISARVLLDLHIQAWKSKLKTTYYVRSTASDISECEWCHS